MSNYLRRRSRAETDTERQDREAARNYRNNRYAGGLISKNYQRDIAAITIGTAPKDVAVPAMAKKTDDPKDPE